jgi:hypothetical protein
MAPRAGRNHHNMHADNSAEMPELFFTAEVGQPTCGQVQQ